MAQSANRETIFGDAIYQIEQQEKKWERRIRDTPGYCAC